MVSSPWKLNTCDPGSMTSGLQYILRFRTFPVWMAIVLHWPFSTVAQQIDFQDYIDSGDPAYELTVENVGGYEDLDFGMVLSGEITRIEFDSDDVAIVRIEGVRYLDVFVDIDPDPVLVRGQSEMPLVLEAAYANRGEGNFGPSFRTEFAGLSARFPIFRRGSGPPAPPPVPPHSGYTPPRETAYIILYGEVDAGAETVTEAGDHTGQIVITVSYDNI